MNRADAAPEPADVPGLQSAVMMIAEYAAAGDSRPRADLIDRLTPRQLDKLIESDRAAAERRDVYRAASLKASVIVTCVVIAAVLVLCWMFLAYAQTEALEKIVAYLIGLASGGVGGYSVGRLRNADAPE